MIKVYGIKAWGSVRKALSFFKENNIEVEFFDFKKIKLDSTQITAWTKKIDINILLNLKGAKYRTLGLKELNLSDEEKISHLAEEPMLFKRPIIESSKDLVVAFNEEVYKNTFL